MAISLSTEDKLEYKFYPLQGSQLQFRVRAPHDARIVLTTGPSEDSPIIEVLLGTAENKSSMLRKNKSDTEMTEAHTPDILSNDEFRGFRITWSEGTIIVSPENNLESPILELPDLEPFEIRYVGVCTDNGATGEWLIEDVSDPAPSAPEMMGITWCSATSGAVPPDAVVAGEDDEPLYVGRAEHEGATIPGKVKPGHGVCYISWGGQEIPKTEYQVLCGCNGIWVPTTGDNIPPNAVLGGETEEGEPLFIGRVNHESTLTIGKVHPSHNCLYIPYGGEEISYKEFEILTS